MTERLHPITLLVFFCFAIILPSISGNPYFFLISLISGLFLLFNLYPFSDIIKSLPGYLILFVLISVFNPIFYHDGNTVLFYLNGKRITFEAFAYGMSSAVMVLAVLTWCRCLTYLFTGDKIMYIFGTFSPKTAIIISMVLRFVPMYRAHIGTYRNTQKQLGIYGEGTFFEKIRGEFKIFGGFLSWLLEHSMTTSDSMAARGYGTKRRRAYNIFHIKCIDIIICIIIGIISIYTIYCQATGTFAFQYYPDIILPDITMEMILAYAAFFLSALIPAILDISYRIRLHHK